MKTENVPKVPPKEGGGNTTSPLFSQDESKEKKKFDYKPAKHHIVTIFNYTPLDIKFLCSKSEELCEKSVLEDWIFEKEICPTTLKPHLQCAFKFYDKKRINQYFGQFEDKWHVETMAKHAKWEDQLFYCSKDAREQQDESLLFAHWYKIPVQLKILKEEQLYPWQKSFIEKTFEPVDDRSINILIDPKTCNGKTQVMKYCAKKYKYIFFEEAEKADIAFSLVSKKKRGIDLNRKQTFIFDIAKGQTKKLDISILEKLKDGAIFSSKYECDELLYNSPHIWVFCNEKPLGDYSRQNVWRLWTIDSNKELIEYIDKPILIRPCCMCHIKESTSGMGNRHLYCKDCYRMKQNII